MDAPDNAEPRSSGTWPQSPSGFWKRADTSNCKKAGSMKRGLPSFSLQCHGDTRSRFSLLWLFLSAILLPANCTAQGGTNVLLITIDTLRADHLGCYGYQGIKTPHIDGLARW